ncbi:MATE family efflux transporter [Clostridium folliculivorans]|uniref:Probable multidrug resistance protein NorM n=2 Tax=Clostridium folliculivorans TaxID=2886038 RepID=A0A9W5Y224_9CLOT|nr:MATE family efflux transporter [Clostridium folliculivorans]GKU28320.1 MATE family efflux transporter [Clostridium folliculivorans]
MVDTVFVGRYVGADAIGGLTIAFPIQRLMIAIGMLIAIGASTSVSRCLGEKNIEHLKRTIINAIMLAIASITVVILIICLFKKSIIIALGASVNTFSFADQYITIILIGGIFQCISTVICYVMNALGNTRVTLYSNIIGSIFNIAINYILVVLMHYGVRGAAIATVVSQILAFIFAISRFRVVKKNFDISFSFKYIRSVIEKEFLFNIITIGFSTFIIEISDAVVSVILNNLLVSHGGDSAIIIVGVITKVSMFMFITIIGISSSMQPIVAYNYGCGNYTKMKEALKTAIIAVSVASMTFWVILMVFANSIIGFFLKDAEILNNAVLAFRICISIIPVIGIYYICIYYYQAIDEAKTSFLLSIYRQLVIFIPISILFVQLFGIIGAWIAYPVSDIISAITSIHFIRQVTVESDKHLFVTNNIIINLKK